MVTLKHKVPCGDCPWRKKAPAGWLGGYEAEWFTERVQREVPLICHRSLEDDKSDFLSESEIIDKYPLCAGALIVQKNMCKLPRDPNHGAAVSAVERSSEVFSHPREFIAHHQGA